MFAYFRVTVKIFWGPATREKATLSHEILNKGSFNNIESFFFFFENHSTLYCSCSCSCENFQRISKITCITCFVLYGYICMYSYCIVPIFCIEKISKEVCTVQFIQFSLIVTLKCWGRSRAQMTAKYPDSGRLQLRNPE